MATDPVFAAFAKTAPLGDLRAYLAYARKKIAQYHLPDATMAIVAEMFRLEMSLVAGVGTTAQQKRQVWETIGRFKASIPGWAGNAGAPGSWANEDAPKAERDRADKAARFRLPWRSKALGPEDVQSLIDAALAAHTGAQAGPPAAKPAARKPAGKGAALPCPTCGAGLTATDRPAVLRCVPCEVTFALVPQARPKASRKRMAKATTGTGRAGVDWAAAGRKAAETRRARQAAALAAAGSAA